MPPLSVLIKPASGLCNMRCDYCFYYDETQKREQESYGFMTEETLKNVVRKTMLKAEKTIGFAFQGGEPLLRGLPFFEKLIEYQNQYNRNNLQIHNALQTNGYAIDDKWCDFFKKNNFLIGLSIDGTEETHDCYRHSKNNEKTHSRIVEAAKLLEKHEVDFNILTVVNKNVAQNIHKIYKYYKEMGWGYQQYIACLDPLGEGHGKNDYALTPEIYGKFLVDLFNNWHKDYSAGNPPYIRQFDNFIGILMGYRPEACDQCGECGLQNVVEADGSVYPCDFYMMDKFKLGNFNSNQLSDINLRRSEIQFIENSRLKNPECLECKYYKVCRGGCQRNKDKNPKTGFDEFYFCESYKMFFDSCLDKMKAIALEVSNQNN